VPVNIYTSGVSNTYYNTIHTNGNVMNQHARNLFTIALAAILALTLLHACEDSMPVKDTPNG
jgi:hypothetical protein